ncbi:hypothetical protein RGR602_PB00282 (plasmid) [Rhizobium gallicum bv. gallicum R602sp]|uniref:Uncharacterized protein n=1 Tax=Rhizobium gallicum bv. gallicum R602sp TaxID=1041138 RepID=A0A0B4X9L5_9HYPH|nr:hypothetical protein RGR602_PB00282 [Rhizobium gallicum bv. gallicum R602sp]
MCLSNHVRDLISLGVLRDRKLRPFLIGSLDVRLSPFRSSLILLTVVVLSPARSTYSGLK